MSGDRRKWAWPLAVVVGSIALALGLTAMRPAVETSPPETILPLVRVLEVRTEHVRMDVETQGTVLPRTESDLVPEVSGTVVWLSPAMASGGFFATGDPLLRIDRHDYETALRRAEASVRALRSQASVATRNRDRSRTLAADGLISRAALDDAENLARVAAAQLAEADAALERATRDLARTEITAPYDGRVRTESVDVGQFVERGRAVARLYAVDYAEVRLPVPDDQLAFLDVPLDGTMATDGPRVDLEAEFAGGRHRWQGRIVRTEGEIDPESRMIHVVARIDDPYDRGNAVDGPPLAVGMFVSATIHGREIPDAVVLPRAALRLGGVVWVALPDGTLREREIGIGRTDHERIVVLEGLAAGDRVCLSPVEGFVDGMRVRTRAPEAA